MNYEKKYKEALERARDMMSYKEVRREDMEYLFPELKGSEDEKIRKQIISFLKEFEYDHYRSLDFSSWITWLEKQGEQKPVEWCSEDEQNLNACLGYIPDEHLRRWLKDIIHAKYDKPSDKVEPKSSWSEEDEKKRTLLIRILEVNHPNGYFKVNPANKSNIEAIHTEELVSWFKSLK